MKFAILGGGTAGWLTAIYLQKHFPTDEVVVVASSEMGILGAGEGTTPAFIDYLKEVGIDENELFKNCRATKKTGIKFTNWNGDQDVYYHNFSNGLYALHFDASLLAKYLQSVAISRGVNLIDDTVISNTDTVLYTEKSGEVKYDFLFDCSGFRKKIIQGYYDEPWVEYQMPCKRAIPFFLPNDGKDLPECTESIAMKYGWVWKIPVNGRYGCGYVYDSTMTTDEEARKEVKELLGFEPFFPTLFNFKPGCFERSWVNNCIAIGLSSNFIEPLEATSIWVQVLALKMFVENFGKEGGREKFNADLKSINEDILSFLYLHYMTERTDSPFWSEFQDNNQIPQKLTDRLDGNMNRYYFNIFNDDSWNAVSRGVRIANPK